MVYRFLNTVMPSDGADALFQWKQFMTGTIHWTVTASSDGVGNFSNSVDILSSGGTGNNGLNNALAWFVIEMPTWDGYQRQYCFQRSNFDDSQWQITYTVSGFLTNGTLTTVPTAGSYNGVTPDQVLLLGKDSGLTQSFQPLFSQSTIPYIFNCIADDAPPYGMFWFAYGQAEQFGSPSIRISSIFLIDPLLPASYPSAFDQDPYVYYIDATTSYTNILMPNIANSLSQNIGQTYVRRGLTHQQFVRQGITKGGVTAACYGFRGGYKINGDLVYLNYVLAPSIPANNQVTNAFNEQDDFFPIYYFALPGVASQFSTYRGASTIISYASQLRYNGDLLSINNPGDYLYLNGVVIPWNNTTLPIL